MVTLMQSIGRQVCGSNGLRIRQSHGQKDKV
jgi:hypothetical protein